MAVQNVVGGQPIEVIKLRRSRELRHTMMPEETILWANLRRNRLNGLHFRRQQGIEDFIVDFYCHAAAIVVEVDGPVHDRTAQYDAERSRILLDRGFRILRFRNEQVRSQLPVVLQEIERNCTSH